MKAQSAMEYLITYGWAILLLGIAIAALYALGIFNVNNFAPGVCSFPADFGCLNSYLLPNGNAVVNIEQSTSYTINITAIGCNTSGSVSGNMIKQSPYVKILIGGNSTFTVPCYTSSNAVYSGKIGSLYSGYLVVNYTDLQTGFQHVVVGTFDQKAA